MTVICKMTRPGTPVPHTQSIRQSKGSINRRGPSVVRRPEFSKIRKKRRTGRTKLIWR